MARVQPSELLAEGDGLRNTLGKVVKLADIKVRVGHKLETSPGDGLGTKVRRELVDGRRCREFTL